jgi:DNA-binding MarR family transcriptional regulator
MPAATPSSSPRRPSRAAAGAYILDDQVGFILRQAYQKNSVIFAGLFGDEFTPTQWATIAKLAETGGCSQNLLGRLTAMDAVTVKGVVDRLTRRGLIQSCPSATDRRRIQITLSALGRKTYDKGVARARQVSLDTLAGLKPREKTTLLRLLKRLR